MKRTKNVFITGGSVGLGAGMAQEFIKRGYFVGVSSRNRSKFEQGPLGNEKNVAYYQVDVFDREKLKASVQDFIKKYGQLDIMIANAGIGNPNKKPLPNWDGMHRIVDINISGVLNTVESAFDHFYENKQGQFVLLSSLASKNGLPGNGMYCASKAAVNILTESFAIDWKRWGIDCTCIQPGFVHTPLTEKNQHRMPFIITADIACQKMVNAIEAKKVFYSFPWQTSLITKLVSRLPRSWYVKFIRKYDLKL
jgi:short-subunit dehydrogenase